MAENAERGTGSSSGVESPERSTSYTEVGRQERRAERSTDGIDAALSQLADVIGGTPPGPTPRPSSPSADTLSLTQRTEIARCCLYSQGMPILTPERVRELEMSLPKLIALLHSLSYRPTLKREVLQLIAMAKPPLASGDRSTPAADHVQELATLIASDLAAQGERILPAVGVAVFMGAYLITKYM